VLAAWQMLGSVPPGLGDIDAVADADAPDQVVIMQGPEAHLVHVYTIDNPPPARAGLPRVISP
jgi:hypothetical protein